LNRFAALEHTRTTAARLMRPPHSFSLWRRGIHGLCALFCAIYCFTWTALAATPFFPLRDVRPGMKGVGRTVFHGGQVEEFQLEILGVLKNSGPKQSIILAKLTGGPLEQTGVMQGMSGSPVYIDGKLLGAVALGFPFSKEPITGIQPIEQMMDVGNAPSAAVQTAANFSQFQREWVSRFESASASRSAQPELRDISTPVSFGGFTESAIERFSNALHGFGFEPQSGVGAGAPTTTAYNGTVEPGSMISVQLMSGDLNVSADGTVTHVDGKKVYAFGHRFLATGSTELPFARAEVVALLPNLNSSFKISAARELVGTITSDVSTGISGEMGRAARMIPMHIGIKDNRGAHTYNIQVVNDRLLTPFLAQMALFSTLDATARTAGAGTVTVQGRVDFDGAKPPLEFNNVFAADSNAALQGTFNLVVPLAFALQAGFADLQIRDISFQFTASEQKRQLEVRDVWLSKSTARPGDSVDINCVLAGDNGLEIQKTATYQIPIGSAAGRLLFTVSDASLLNFSEMAGLSPASAHSGTELIGLLNRIRPNDKVYVRVWRQQPSFSLPGADLTDPPPSVALILSDTSSALAAGSSMLASRGAQVMELPVALGDYALMGSKTVQLDIKE
jgi:SpoIVB peptidase S55